MTARRDYIEWWCLSHFYCIQTICLRVFITFKMSWSVLKTFLRNLAQLLLARDWGKKFIWKVMLFLASISKRWSIVGLLLCRLCLRRSLNRFTVKIRFNMNFFRKIVDFIFWVNFLKTRSIKIYFYQVLAISKFFISCCCSSFSFWRR